MRIYMCYQRNDNEKAQSIAALLGTFGARVFLDKDSIPAGAEWERVLERELESSDAVVLLWSMNAAKSPHVMRELSAAILKKRLLVPCAIDDTPISPLVEDRQVLDYRLDGAAEKLITALSLRSGLNQEPRITPTLASAVETYNAEILKRYGQLRVLGRGTDKPLEALYLPLSLTLRGEDGEDSAPSPANPAAAASPTERR